MSTLVPPSPPDSEERHDAKALEALIEEARQRARRRRRGYAALALLAVAAGVLGLSVLDSGGGTGTAAPEGGVGAQVTDGRWRPATGLEGGTITALAVDPQNPESVFAATVQAGVFKSADGARTWRSLNLPSRLGRPDAIAIAPADPETLYVGTGRGVAKTTDGGRSWRLTGSDLRGKRMRGEFYLRGLEGFVYTLLVDQRDPDIVYAGTWNRGLLKSTNGGASWRRTGLGAVSTLVFDPRDPGTLYAGAVGAAIPYWDAMEKVSDGAGRGRGGVFKSSDQGESWDPVGLQGTTVHALALDPEHPGTMYAAARQHQGRRHRFQRHPEDDGRRRELAQRGPQRPDDHRPDAGSEQHRHRLRNDAVVGRRLQERGRGPQPQLANHRRHSVRGDRPRVLHRPRARPAQPCDDLRRHEGRPSLRGGGWCLEEPRRRPQLAIDERGSERRRRVSARPRAG